MAEDIPVIEEILDPADLDHRFLDFSAKLRAGEDLVGSSVTLSLDLSSTNLGVQIPTSGPYAPTSSGKVVQWWMSVSVGQQNNAAFTQGHTAIVTVTVDTDSTPPRTIQRSCKVLIRNR